MRYPEGTGPEFHIVYVDETAGDLRTLLGPHTTYDLWHDDQAITPNIQSTTLFWVLESPASSGGDTAFISPTAAYEALSPASQKTLASLKPFPTSASAGEIVRVGPELAISTTHPLVMEHLITGKSSPFVNPTIAGKIEGLLAEESDNQLKFLHAYITSPDISCRVR